MNSKNKICAIVACDPNGVIGINGELPWYLPEDLEWFKNNTMDKVCVASKTLYSSTLKNLKGRHWVSISSNPGELAIPEYNYNFYTARQVADDLNTDIMIVGGPKVYEWAMPDLTDVILTGVKKEYKGDAYINIDKLLENKYCYTSMDTNPEYKFTMWRTK